MTNKHTLWNEKYRPDTLEGYLGNETFINSLEQWIRKNDFPNLLLYGPAGTGKTTAAKLVVKNINCDFLYLNCSDENGIDTIRDKVKQFASGATFKPLKVIILDEADFLTINAQAALRNIIESFSLTTRFIFTCNYVERIIDALQSRLTSFHLAVADIKIVAKHLVSILDAENVEYDTHDVVNVIKKTIEAPVFIEQEAVRLVTNVTIPPADSLSPVVSGKLVLEETYGFIVSGSTELTVVLSLLESANE
jgi:DNA polymerase III delta prime subunit